MLAKRSGISIANSETGQRKLAEGKSAKEALRCLKRRLSDAVYRCLLADQHLGRAWPGGGRRDGAREPRLGALEERHRVAIGVKDGELPRAPRLGAQPAVGMHHLTGLTPLVERGDAMDL
jgi:hypothetical protein